MVVLVNGELTSVDASAGPSVVIAIKVGAPLVETVEQVRETRSSAST